MKKLLPLALLLGLLAGGCSKQDASQVAVSAYIKQGLGDPASYEPARWGQSLPFKQRDADTIAARRMLLTVAGSFALMQAQQDTMQQFARVGAEDYIFNYHKNRFLATTRRTDSLNKAMQRLRASTDTAKLGTLLTHSFRAKNKLGALVLDSAKFVIYKSGKVAALD